MARKPRALMDGSIYHVFNRGNNRGEVFHDTRGYQEFLALLEAAATTFPTRILAYCLMPNHFHLVLWPEEADLMVRAMHWLTNTHCHRYKIKYETVGHIWQGRYKSVAVQNDSHLLTLVRYVEGNPVRAGLCTHGIEWRWSSIHERLPGTRHYRLLSALPLDLPANWLTLVDQPMHSDALQEVRLGITKGVPLGNEEWREAIKVHMDRLRL